MFPTAEKASMICRMLAAFGAGGGAPGAAEHGCRGISAAVSRALGRRRAGDPPWPDVEFLDGLAGATGVAPVEQLTLPAQRDSEFAWLPTFGLCRLEPLPGGWLVTVTGSAGAPAPQFAATSAELDLRDPRFPVLAISSASGQWRHRLSPRHAELLLILATARDGR